MKRFQPTPSSPPFPATLAVALTLFLAGCGGGGGGGGGGGSPGAASTKQAVAGTTPIAIAERWVAYLAEESDTGDPGVAAFTDLNGDGDFVDSVPTVLDMVTGTQEVLNVAADPGPLTPLVWVDQHLYLAVDESRGPGDWNGDLVLDDLVLLHWTSGSPVTFVDELPATGIHKLIAVGGQLFYTSAVAPVAGMDSNLRAVDPTQPTTPIDVFTTNGANPLVVQILGAEEGLLFLLLDESAQTPPVDLNGEGTPDTTDLVLALLDGTAPAGSVPIQSTGLAVDDASVPHRASARGAGDWLVGFLVSESAQDETSFNDPNLPELTASWLPTQCGFGHRDQDTNDQVLFFLNFAAWRVNPITNAPRNTGIAGSLRIVAAPERIGTIAEEGRDGEVSVNGPCDLNQDGDEDDSVVRWVTAPLNPAAPVALPAMAENNFRAVEDVPGGTHGLFEFEGRWIVVVDEEGDTVDYDLDGLDTHDFVAILDPTVTADWDFIHLSGGLAMATWVAVQDDGQALVALSEVVNGTSFNGDADATDSVPTFLRLNPGGLTFPGVGIAVDADDAGIVLEKDILFYKVDEAADSKDRNEDGDGNDFVTLRTNTVTGATATVSTASSIARRPAIVVETGATPIGGVIVADEADQTANGSDFNGDGDAMPDDFVIRWLRF